MPEKLTYLLVNLLSLLFPLIFSFHHKFGLHGKQRAFYISLLIPAAFFILWDIWFTYLGVWSFNASRTIGIDLLGLPVEEWMFFFCIPYACVFTYNVICEHTSWNIPRHVSDKLIPALVILLTMTAVFNYERIYTSLSFMLCGILLFYFYYISKAMWFGKFLISYLVLLIPFFITNGVLTGSFISSPVVIYNDAYNLNIRLFTIPLEDLLYGFSMILMPVALFEFTLKKNEAAHPDLSF